MEFVVLLKNKIVMELFRLEGSILFCFSSILIKLTYWIVIEPA